MGCLESVATHRSGGKWPPKYTQRSFHPTLALFFSENLSHLRLNLRYNGQLMDKVILLGDYASTLKRSACGTNMRKSTFIFTVILRHFQRRADP